MVTKNKREHAKNERIVAIAGSSTVNVVIRQKCDEVVDSAGAYATKMR